MTSDTAFTFTIKPPPPENQPGYCAACGRYALLTPQGACANSPSCAQRLQPPEPYDGPHACNTGYRRKESQPEYRRCECGQWLHAREHTYWYRVNRPPARWLREHGLNVDDSWYAQEDNADPFGDMHYTGSRIWYQFRGILRTLLRS